MAQSKVKDFFASRKKIDDTQPAKRRKIEVSKSDVKSNYTVTAGDVDDPIEAVASVQTSKGDMTETLTKSRSRSIGLHIDLHDVSSRSRPTGTTKLKGKGKTYPLSKRHKAKDLDKTQSKVTDFVVTRRRTTSSAVDALIPSVGTTQDCTNPEQDEKEKVNPSSTRSSACAPLDFETETEVIDEVTSVWDDHNRDCLSTPRKRTVCMDSVPQGHKIRKQKTVSRKLIHVDLDLGLSATEDSSIVADEFDSARKKLDLVSTLSPEQTASQARDLCDEVDKEVDAALFGKSRFLTHITDVTMPPVALSPLPTTPERKEEEATASSEPISEKLQNLTQKLKSLSEVKGQALKNRLKKSGKFDAVAEKICGLDRALSKAKTPELVRSSHAVAEPVKDEGQNKQAEATLPAHQRFEYLTAEGIPKLSLPFSYRVLEGTYRAMDTVVSMLHNRAEMCTFSKLQSGVQSITKRNFEEKTLGQVKTVVPKAYILRQENNIPAFGKKLYEYQLTVEANLDEEDSNDGKDKQKTSDGRLLFSPSALVRRKNCFRNCLLDRVKQIHKSFLASLSPPLNIPDEQLTRWHPRFQLDKIPEVIASALPQPPEVKVYHSAKDVLERQEGRLNPRVEKALKVVVESTSSESCSTSDLNQNSRSKPLPSSPSPPQKPNTSSLKGIPPALLAKIRAKEAEKMHRALTRDPAEDNKTKMMNRLPEFIRILRSYFVTEKKPALPLGFVYKKLSDSYRSGMSEGDVEQHVNLLHQLAPELITIVEIKRGKFLKLDKNVDIQAVSARILNLVKSRK